MASQRIQYGQYVVPTVDEQVNFNVGQVRCPLSCFYCCSRRHKDWSSASFDFLLCAVVMHSID